MFQRAVDAAVAAGQGGIIRAPFRTTDYAFGNITL